ncbi:hypothetical protein [Methyloligella solikamskensis]|uniref:Trimeric autotransporter adhesin n=1 Tax=Methyloligella solikamskensis TaxID=1177756 RepID=A0ABW3J876_9HYPH
MPGAKKGKPWLNGAVKGALTLGVGVVLVAGLPADKAQAVECENSGAGGPGPAGDDGGVINNTACGAGADASGLGGANTAVGSGANASGTDGALNTATGSDSNASGAGSANVALGQSAQSAGATSNNVALGNSADAAGDGGSNIALGVGAGASGAFTSNIAIGNFAQSSDNAIALGAGSNATGALAVGFLTASANGGAAIGNFSTATGVESTAIGPRASATAQNSVAVGAGASATHTNAAAFGAGATTTRANQQVFGTASNTYTMPGLTSSASRSAQGSPTHLVTSNAAGDLAAYTPTELGLATGADLVQLRERDDELTEGIAVVASLAQPIMLPGQSFVMRAGWGQFDDASALGFTAAGIIAKDVLRPGAGTLVLDGGLGVGTGEGQVSGRAGMSFGW